MKVVLKGLVLQTKTLELHTKQDAIGAYTWALLYHAYTGADQGFFFGGGAPVADGVIITDW